MSLNGKIGTISLAGLLQLLSNEQKTGILSVRYFDMEFQVFFLDGYIMYAVESLKAARLGELLINDKILDQDQLKKYLDISKKKKQALGKTLVENKVVNKAELEKYLYIQVQEIIFSMFCLQEGEFSYRNTKFDMRWLIPARLNTLQLVMDALRRIDDNKS